jgi:predicted membrane channel-forming protein YqfA (hemolysin III family)
MKQCEGQEDLRLSEKAKTSDYRKLHAWILWIVGIILVIAGIAVATIRGTHLRGTGLGTALLVLGFVLLIIGVIRYMYKKPQ